MQWPCKLCMRILRTFSFTFYVKENESHVACRMVTVAGRTNFGYMASRAGLHENWTESRRWHETSPRAAGRSCLQYGSGFQIFGTCSPFRVWIVLHSSAVAIFSLLWLAKSASILFLRMYGAQRRRRELVKSQFSQQCASQNCFSCNRSWNCTTNLIQRQEESGWVLCEGYGHGGPGVCLGDGQTDAKEVYRRKMNTAMRCSGVCPHTWPTWPDHIQFASWISSIYSLGWIHPRLKITAVFYSVPDLPWRWWRSCIGCSTIRVIPWNIPFLVALLSCNFW